MIVYISGPITGVPNNNREAFERAERALTEAGHVVLNPLILPKGLTYQQYMDIDLAMVRAADAICMLDGWTDSKGARAEYQYAYSLGLQVLGGAC